MYSIKLKGILSTSTVVHTSLHELRHCTHSSAPPTKPVKGLPYVMYQLQRLLPQAIFPSAAGTAHVAMAVAGSLLWGGDVPFSPPVPFVVGFATRVLISFFRRILWSVFSSMDLLGVGAHGGGGGARGGVFRTLHLRSTGTHSVCSSSPSLQSDRLDTRTGGREVVHMLGYADSA